MLFVLSVLLFAQRETFRVVGMLPRIDIGVDVWVESSIMTGVYEPW